jgi:hypothetical protein
VIASRVSRITDMWGKWLGCAVKVSQRGTGPAGRSGQWQRLYHEFGFATDQMDTSKFYQVEHLVVALARIAYPQSLVDAL